MDWLTDNIAEIIHDSKPDARNWPDAEWKMWQTFTYKLMDFCHTYDTGFDYDKFMSKAGVKVAEEKTRARL